MLKISPEAVGRPSNSRPYQLATAYPPGYAASRVVEQEERSRHERTKKTNAKGEK
jgi:hypothetical protein